MRIYRIAGKNKWRKVDSTFVNEIAYDEELQTLSVNLRGGKIYNFKDVTKDIYKRFLKNRSKGKFFNKFIKDNYEWGKSESS